MRRSRTKSLADSGDFVAGWLSDPESDWGYGRESQQQAADLVLALVTLREKVLKGIKADQTEQEIAVINDMLARYPYVLRLGKVSRGGAFEFYERISPGGLIDIIFRLARAGVLDRLRQCAHCGKWFFARNPRGIFHDTKCRQAAHHSSAEYREKNREYQRTYYRDVLSPVTAKHLKRPGQKREKGRSK